MCQAHLAHFFGWDRQGCLSYVIAILVAIAFLSQPALAQESAGPAKKQDDAVQRIQKLLDERLVESRHFQKEMPLSKFLQALEKQLPKDKKLSLRIDGEAFGHKLAELAATRVALPAAPKKISLRRALEIAIGKAKAKADYRIGAAEIAITTPQRALYTVVYDIRYFLGQPQPQHLVGNHLDFRNSEPAKRARLVVQNIVSSIDLDLGTTTAATGGSIEILNGTRLEVRTNAARQAQVADFLQALRRLGGVSVILKAELYQVERASYEKVANAKRLSMADWEELERQFLDRGGIPVKGESLWKLLEKQKPILVGEEVRIDNGMEGAFLSRHHVVSCLPSPDQLIKGQARQTVMEGVSFLAGIGVSPDRRYVWLKITEKSDQLQVINKSKVPWYEKDVHAEQPLVDEYVHSRVQIIADGGSELIPVHYRPRSARAKDRWWVLSITARIYIEEEEQQIRTGAMSDVLPNLVADLLKNPHLQAARDLFGTPGDKRFALVNSGAWTWPKDFRPAVPGYQVVSAKRDGKRLLGIRIDGYDGPAVTVTLVNAGGSANGPAVGGCTVRYRARHTEKGWAVELAKPSLDR